MSYTPKYTSTAECSTAVSPAVLVQVYDDDNDGTADPAAVLLAVELAEGFVDSYLIGQNIWPLPTTTPPPVAADRLLRLASIEYFRAQTFERHPEYVRSNRADAAYKRAEAVMNNCRKAVQRPPDLPVAPTNVGGDTTSTVGDPNFPTPPSPVFDNMGDF